MKSKFIQILRALWEGLWFVPGLLTGSALLLAVMLTGLSGWEWFGTDLETEFEPSAAGGVLTSLGAGAITVAAVVFSITMVVLSSAATQFGPRLMPNFMRKTGSKLAIGGFVGSFVYQMVVAAALACGRPVPDVAVWIGIVGGLGAFTILLGFLNMVVRFIRVPYIIDEVTHDLKRALSTISGKRPGSGPDRSGGTDTGMPVVAEYPATKDGYLQMIETDSLFGFAERTGGLVVCRKSAGKFVCAGEVLAVLHAPEGGEPPEFPDAFALGPDRTAQQDVEFAIRQLVEIAAKALSPGINDPFTAINVIERLGGAIAGIASDKLDPGLWRDGDGKLRLVVPTPDAMGLMDAAYNPLRQNARSYESVSFALLDSFLQLAERPLHPDFAAALGRHAGYLFEDLERRELGSRDRQDFEERRGAILAALGKPA